MTRNDPLAIDECFAAFNAHAAACRHCSNNSPCAIGKRLAIEGAKEAEKRLGHVMNPRAKS